MKKVWMLSDEEMERLVAIMHRHTDLALEATEPTTSRKRKIQIMGEIEKLRKLRIEILES